MLCCLLILIILLIIFLLVLQRDDSADQTDPPTFAPFIDDTDDDYFYDDDIILAPGVVTAPMDNPPRGKIDCRDYQQGADGPDGYQNVFIQCACWESITTVPEDVQQMRDLILDRVGEKFYDDNETIPLNSCDPRNLALIWLASGDNRDAGEPRQRYALALSFFQLNGTIWDFTDGWMTDLNECLWMGVQCNNRDTVNSFALDTNNIFGPVSPYSEILLAHYHLI